MHQGERALRSTRSWIIGGGTEASKGAQCGLNLFVLAKAMVRCHF